MNEYPKTLILTTNRTTTGEPVYAPCGYLRALIAQWREYAQEVLELDSTDAYAAAVKDCANTLEAALKPSGDLVVARPLQIGVEYSKEEVKP